jgi:hypothetical protein
MKTSFRITSLVALTTVVSLSLISGGVKAQTIDPFFAGSYSLVNLGSADGVPTNYGGVTVDPNNTNFLLLGGAANGGDGAIYRVPVTRNGSGNITGFAGAATLFSTSPEIDGGLMYGPDGVLFYTGYAENLLGMIRPGSVTPDKIVELSPLGVAISVGSLVFRPGTNQLKVVSWSGGQYYELAYSPDGAGTFNITGATQLLGGENLSGGPEGLAYAPNGSPLLANNSMLVSEYSAGLVGVYETDANGDPILNTRRTFISGLTGAEGAAIDPVTGDFIFSTFGGSNQVIVVRGFGNPNPGAAAPEPGTVALFGIGLVAMGNLMSKRRR